MLCLVITGGELSPIWLPFRIENLNARARWQINRIILRGEAPRILLSRLRSPNWINRSAVKRNFVLWNNVVVHPSSCLQRSRPWVSIFIWNLFWRVKILNSGIVAWRGNDLILLKKPGVCILNFKLWKTNDGVRLRIFFLLLWIIQIVHLTFTPIITFIAAPLRTRPFFTLKAIIKCLNFFNFTKLKLMNFAYFLCILTFNGTWLIFNWWSWYLLIKHIFWKSFCVQLYLILMGVVVQRSETLCYNGWVI